MQWQVFLQTSGTTADNTVLTNMDNIRTLPYFEETYKSEGLHKALTIYLRLNFTIMPSHGIYTGNTFYTTKQVKNIVIYVKECCFK